MSGSEGLLCSSVAGKSAELDTAQLSFLPIDAWTENNASPVPPLL